MPRGRVWLITNPISIPTLTLGVSECVEYHVMMKINSVRDKSECQSFPGIIRANNIINGSGA